MSRVGLFLSLEGGDACGKLTQQKMLVDRLHDAGVPVLAVDFPRYETPLGHLIERMLRDPDYGDATKQSPKMASHIFALDRLFAGPEITSAIEEGTTVVTNRFSASNMAHQGAKFGNPTDRETFYDWAYQLEHVHFGLPFPQHILLRLPAAVARERLTRSGKELDQHELNLDYQVRAESAYGEVAQRFSSNFTIVECVDGDYEKTPDEIHKEVWREFEELRG